MLPFLRKKHFIACFCCLLLSACSISKEERFEKEATEQNRLYPMVVDTFTRIDSIRYISDNNTFCYYYTLTGDADNQAIAMQMRDNLEKTLPEEIKRATGMAIHRKHNVAMEYIYFSERNGHELFRVKITPDMYK